MVRALKHNSIVPYSTFDSSDGSDETARMRRLVWSFSARRRDKLQHLRHYEHFDIRKRV